MGVAVTAEPIARTEEPDAPVLAEAPETPVFLGARRRVTWLRAAGAAVGALVVLWLIALVAGVLGFGNVTGLSLPGLDRANKPVLHRTTSPVVPALGGSRSASDARRKSSTSISLRARGTPPRSRSRVFAGRRARGQGRSSAPRRAATRTPSISASPSAGTIHGKHLGSNSGSGTSSPSTSTSHRVAAPGRQRSVTAAPAPASPNARRNRLTTTG
jgi:hypothetical protein